MFLAIVGIDRLRAEDGRLWSGCCCREPACGCTVDTPDNSEKHPPPPEEKTLARFLRTSFAPALLRPRVKAVVGVSFVVMIGLLGFSAKDVKVAQTPEDISPSGSYLQARWGVFFLPLRLQFFWGMECIHM